MENKNISLEQIDLLMQRAQVSYTDAKEALEHTDGDLLEAILWLEQNGKVNQNTSSTQKSHRTSEKVNGFIDKLLSTRFKMYKKDMTYLNVSLILALIVIVSTLHISLIALLLSLVMGVRIELEGDNDIAEKVNAGMDKIQK